MTYRAVNRSGEKLWHSAVGVLAPSTRSRPLRSSSRKSQELTGVDIESLHGAR